MNNKATTISITTTQKQTTLNIADRKLIRNMFIKMKKYLIYITVQQQYVQIL